MSSTNCSKVPSKHAKGIFPGSTSSHSSKATGGFREAQCTQYSQRQDRRGEEGTNDRNVRIDIGGGAIVTSSITNEAVDELKLASGQSAYAVIKASDVMIAID